MNFVSNKHNQWCKIKFLGVRNIVDALEIPFKELEIFMDWIPLFRHKYHN